MRGISEEEDLLVILVFACGYVLNYTETFYTRCNVCEQWAAVCLNVMFTTLTTTTCQMWTTPTLQMVPAWSSAQWTLGHLPGVMYTDPTAPMSAMERCGRTLSLLSRLQWQIMPANISSGWGLTWVALNQGFVTSPIQIWQSGVSNHNNGLWSKQLLWRSQGRDGLSLEERNLYQSLMSGILKKRMCLGDGVCVVV